MIVERGYDRLDDGGGRSFFTAPPLRKVSERQTLEERNARP